MAQQVVRLEAAGRWPGDVEVWHVAIPPCDSRVDDSVLEAAEHERASRYRQDADRVRYKVTRAALRQLLGDRLGVDAASLQFATARNGRPELAGAASALSFNVSHSGEHALIAVSVGGLVGVDVEHVDPRLNWQELLDLVCTDSEQRALRGEPVWCQRHAFFRYWTAKEALLKAVGLGIAEGLHAVAVQRLDDGVQSPVVPESGVFARAADLRYHWLTDIPGYMGCVAFDGT